MITKYSQLGMTIIEVLGALAITAILLLSLTAMVNSSMDEVKGQQTALHQEQVVNAANKYISTNSNYADLLDKTKDGSVATITLAQLKAGGFLSNSFSSTNAFNQTPCVLVRQSSSGKLDAMIATYGGLAIPERDIPLVAMYAGQGGGYISTAAPGTARGASWSLVTTAYRNVVCDGTMVLTGAAANDGGHLVSSLFYDGPGQLSTDFLYRNAVPGRPDLNQMNTPIHMVPGTAAQAAEDDDTDPRCTVASGTGKIAIDASGHVLSCQSGVWKRQGFGSWKEPVQNYGDLPPTGNTEGDVRMVTALNRAFTWTGASWIALAIDQNGDLMVPGMLTANLMKLNQTVVKNDPCSDDGMIARDAAGRLLSCKSGSWRNPLEFRLTTLAYENSWRLDGPAGVKPIYIDLASLPGPRPLYVTGYMHCHSTGFPRAYANMTIKNNVGSPPYTFNGGCMVRRDGAGIGVLNKGFIDLQQIPEDAVQIQLHLEVEAGAAPEDFIDLVLKIYNSE